MAIPTQTQTYTLAEFTAFADRPDHTDRLFELLDGEIIEVSPGRATNPRIGHLLAAAVIVFCKANAIPCYTSGETAAFLIGGQVVVPDFIYQRDPFTGDYPEPAAPLWVVEIISPTDKPYQIGVKRALYIRERRLYWEVYPPLRQVHVYAFGHEPRFLGSDDLLDGGDVLPGFALPVRELFAE